MVLDAQPGDPVLGAMIEPLGGSPPPQALARFSADGLWWWDGAEWKPAVSADGHWRWPATAWVPAKPAGGDSSAVGVTIGLVAAFVGVLVVVSVVVAASLDAVGDQIATVFSNVVGTLASR